MTLDNDERSVCSRSAGFVLTVNGRDKDLRSLCGELGSSALTCDAAPHLLTLRPMHIWEGVWEAFFAELHWSTIVST